MNDTPAKPADFGASLSHAVFKLKSSGLRVTKQRLSILGALIKFGRPTSTGALFSNLDAHHCDFVTMYRSLAAFENIGLVRRTFQHDGTQLLELELGEPKFYVLSRDGSEVAPLDERDMIDLREILSRINLRLSQSGKCGVSHVVQFYSRS